MNRFYIILEELRRGENVDLYITVLIASLIAILNTLGFVPQSLLSSVTLAVLALIIGSILGIRHRLETIDRISATAQSDAQKLIASLENLADYTSRDRPSPQYHFTFSEAFQHWLEPYESIDEMLILAYTSYTSGLSTI